MKIKKNPKKQKAKITFDEEENIDKIDIKKIKVNEASEDAVKLKGGNKTRKNRRKRRKTRRKKKRKKRKSRRRRRKTRKRRRRRRRSRNKKK